MRRLVALGSAIFFTACGQAPFSGSCSDVMSIKPIDLLLIPGNQIGSIIEARAYCRSIGYESQGHIVMADTFNNEPEVGKIEDMRTRSALAAALILASPESLAQTWDCNGISTETRSSEIVSCSRGTTMYTRSSAEKLATFVAMEKLYKACGLDSRCISNPFSVRIKRTDCAISNKRGDGGEKLWTCSVMTAIDLDQEGGISLDEFGTAISSERELLRPRMWHEVSSYRSGR